MKLLTNFKPGTIEETKFKYVKFIKDNEIIMGYLFNVNDTKIAELFENTVETNKIEIIDKTHIEDVLLLIL